VISSVLMPECILAIEEFFMASLDSLVLFFDLAYTIVEFLLECVKAKFECLTSEHSHKEIKMATPDNSMEYTEWLLRILQDQRSLSFERLRESDFMKKADVRQYDLLPYCWVLDGGHANQNQKRCLNILQIGIQKS